MKKLLFTALAVVAFSGVAMASTIISPNENDFNQANVECFNYEILTQPEIENPEDGCYSYAAHQLDLWYTCCTMSDVTANDTYQTLFSLCMIGSC